MSDFTPGPWRVDPNANCDIQTSDGLLEVAATHPSLLTGGRNDPARARGNANLIAAAPELYEALSWFINDIDGTHTVMLDFDANVERARAALAKARGEL
ncbi:hypothetical protein GCM10007897_42540 [Sphingobium jiangsuense]|uniref:Uncharacterized protein n=1 Tax=Sphingobium jiangsuense TaxID=870476 RepID=A0A7W6FSM8_9SPHN|nr:hypothetical protein [Sphingobium jiangsuense]MBB3928917.1 hypothetical protein [Sphingobium jiangsuense]GLT02830.1 hypothetical protein GCM10007897_42540 [Sphingobium jiangsuense]